jgi:signal transduction histidine kinase
MSHEIRMPMNAVIGMLELALNKAKQGVMNRFAIEVASGAARGLLDLIGDILDIARIESVRLSLAPERANLRELLESVVRIFDGLARQKRLALVLDQGTQIEVTLDLPTLEPLSPAPSTEEALGTPGQPLNILVIDEYPANRLLLSQQLSYLGHRIEDAEDGAHDLRAWRNGHFDVVITDCNMPIMTG